MKKTLLILLLEGLFHVTSASTYYVDSRVVTSGNGLSSSSPFKSYSSVPLAAGDQILFACGSNYSQSITISLTNVAFGSYGTGAKPFFSNSTNWYVFMVSGSGITVDGLQFGISTYSGIELTGSGNIIMNCLFSGMPKGIAVSGASNHIHHNTFRDGIMQPGKNGPNDDVGALGICLNTGANTTEIEYNSFIHCKAPSPDYGEDGGAVEIYGSVSGINIHHNYAEDCCGLIEMGGGTIQNVEIYRNLFKNNYGLGGIHTTGTFAAIITNINYAQNTMYDTSGGTEVFWVYGTSGQSQVKFINNIIFYKGFQKFSSAAGIIHQNNVFYSPSGNPLGITADISETYGINPYFVSNTDYHLTSGSVAINKGQTTAYTADYDGLPLVGNPDAGCYEYQSGGNTDTTPPSTPTNLIASSITPSSFTLSWNASTDNVGVIGYDIYKNGTYLASSTGTTASISGLSASTSYSMTVLAKDAAGNFSPQSAALNVTTSSNMLINPGFENGTTSWSGSGSNIVASTIRYAGSYGLLTSSRTGAWSGPQQDVTSATAAAGTGAYYAEAYVRMASGSATVRITIKYVIGGVTYYARTAGVSIGKSAFKKVSGTLNLNISGTLQNAVYYIETVSGTSNFYADECWLNKGSVKSGLAKIVNDEYPTDQSINIYPNPVTNGILNIEWPSRLFKQPPTIKLFENTGKAVRAIKPENQKSIQIPTEGLKAGLYILNFRDYSGVILNRKIIIQ